MNAPSDDDSPTRLLKLLVVRLLILAAVAAGAGFLGYVFGRSYGPAHGARRSVSACPPAHADAADLMTKRNTVWRVWNGENDSLPDTPERALASALALMLASDSTGETRNLGMSLYLQKSIVYFSEEEAEAVRTTMGSGSPAELADALRRIAAADSEAADLIQSVLADSERVERFTSGSLPIPLETPPDGGTP